MEAGAGVGLPLDVTVTSVTGAVVYITAAGLNFGSDLIS
jgi:hypothetical protein